MYSSVRGVFFNFVLVALIGVGGPSLAWSLSNSQSKFSDTISKVEAFQFIKAKRPDFNDYISVMDVTLKKAEEDGRYVACLYFTDCWLIGKRGGQIIDLAYEYAKQILENYKRVWIDFRTYDAGHPEADGVVVYRVDSGPDSRVLIGIADPVALGEFILAVKLYKADRLLPTIFVSNKRLRPKSDPNSYSWQEAYRILSDGAVKKLPYSSVKLRCCNERSPEVQDGIIPEIIRQSEEPQNIEDSLNYHQDLKASIWRPWRFWADRILGEPKENHGIQVEILLSRLKDRQPSEPFPPGPFMEKTIVRYE